MTSEAPLSSEVSTPVLLLVGAAPSLKHALVEALTRHGVYVETVAVSSAQRTVVVTAPDLVVLADDAVQDGGARVMLELASSPLTSFVPVAILYGEPSLEQRLEAFRRGAAAVLPRLPSIDAMAEKLAELAREIPERSSQNFGELGESTLRDFTEALSRQLRARVLAQTSSGLDKEVRLVFGGGRPLARLVDDFVQQLEHHVVRAEAFAAHTQTEPSHLLLGESELLQDGLSLKGLRVALADEDAARADAVAQDLRTRGATVLVTDLDPNDLRFDRLRGLDPNVFIVGEQQLEGAGHALVRRAHSDSRLRWATLLVVDWEQLCPQPGQPFALDQLAERLIMLMGAEQELRRRVLEGTAFDTRLEITGPARLLYVLVDAPAPVRVTVQAPRVRVELDISDSLIIGATTSRIPNLGERLQGPAALAALLTLSAGRVGVTPVVQPAATNIMAAVDLALDLAEKELQTGRVRSSSIRPERQVSGVVSLEQKPSEVAVPSRPITRNERGPGITSPESRMSAVPVRPSPKPSAIFNRAVFVPRWFVSRRLRMVALLGVAVGLSVVVLIAILVIGREPESRPASPPYARRGIAAALARSVSANSRPSGSMTSGSVGDLTPPREPGAQAGTLTLPAATNPAAPRCDELVKEGAPTPAVGPPAAASYEFMIQGRRALVRGDLDKAQRAYCSAMGSDPGNVAAQVELAKLLLIRRDGNAGLREVEKALHLDPGSCFVKGLLGDALARVGRYEEAKRAWFDEAQLTEQSKRAGHLLVVTQLHAARRQQSRHVWGEAERLFRRVAVLEPANVEASLGLAQALLSLGVTEEAAAWVRYARQMSPNHPMAMQLLRQLGKKESSRRREGSNPRLRP